MHHRAQALSRQQFIPIILLGLFEVLIQIISSIKARPRNWKCDSTGDKTIVAGIVYNSFCSMHGSRGQRFFSVQIQKPELSEYVTESCWDAVYGSSCIFHRLGISPFPVYQQLNMQHSTKDGLWSSQHNCRGFRSSLIYQQNVQVFSLEFSLNRWRLVYSWWAKRS